LVDQAKEMINSAPRYWETYRVLGEIYSWFGEIGLCIEMHERAIELCPTDRHFSLSRLHYLLSTKLILEGAADAACAQALEALSLHNCFQTLFLYGRCQIYTRQYTEAEKTLELALECAGNSNNEFFVLWELFKVHKRRCEDAKGNELWMAGKRALQFWLSTTQLVWDCPANEQVSMLDDVFWVITSLCSGLMANQQNQFDRDRIIETENLLVRFDDVMTALGNVEWPSLIYKDRFRKHLLESLYKSLYLFENLPISIREKIDRGIELAEVKPQIQISENIKVWYSDRRFGFVTAVIEGEEIDIFFNQKSLRQTSDEFKLNEGKTKIAGSVNRSNDGRYFLSKVIVD
jgi:tetratricopeptide (TPR) repeat protein